MKKIALVLAIVIVLSSMSLLLFACTAKVAGKTYVMESYDITAEGAPQSLIDNVKSVVESTYKTAELTFNKDGTMVVKAGDTELEKDYYKQVGKNIYVSDTEEVKTDGDPVFTVDGKKIVWTRTETIMSYTVVVKMVIVQKK